MVSSWRLCCHNNVMSYTLAHGMEKEIILALSSHTTHETVSDVTVGYTQGLHRASAGRMN